MIARRFRLCFAFLALVSMCGGTLFAQTTDFVQNAEETLTADVLAKTLFAKTPAEEKYCENVIAARDAKILPNRILYSAYQYAMKKDRTRRFIHFQAALAQLCKDAGVTLPTSPPAKKTSFNPFSLLFGNTR